MLKLYKTHKNIFTAFINSSKLGHCKIFAEFPPESAKMLIFKYDLGKKIRIQKILSIAYIYIHN